MIEKYLEIANVQDRYLTNLQQTKPKIQFIDLKLVLLIDIQLSSSVTVLSFLRFSQQPEAGCF